MVKFKFFKTKYIFYLLTIIFLGYIFNEHILRFYKYYINNVNGTPPDEIKLQFYIISSSTSLLFKLSFISSFIIPISISLLGFDYLYIKNNLLKYNVGKNDGFNKRLTELKIKLTLIPIIQYIFVILIAYFVFIIFANDSVFQQIDFNSKSILNYLIFEKYTWLIFKIITISIAIFVNSFLIFEIVNYFNNVPKAIFAYLIFVMMFSIVLYRIIPFYFVPMSSFMITAYGNLDLLQVFSPYIIYIIAIVIFRRMKNEI